MSQKRTALVTGASRGIGAATAVKLGELGFNVVVNYRSKGHRAEQVADSTRKLGVQALAVQADLTIEAEVRAMMRQVARNFGTLDLLILNASGGLEKDKTEEYAMALNRDAQLQTARFASELMRPGARIVFVTSHWAHFYGMKPVMPEYEPVAKSKRAGEDALRSYAEDLRKRGISFAVVSGDAIAGTITLRLLERQRPGVFDARREEASLPTVNQFAAAIVDLAIRPDIEAGHTVFIGPAKW